MKVFGIALSIFGLGLASALGLAAGAPAHWDVAAMQARVAAEKLSFTAKESWVTRFLAQGGELRTVTGLLHDNHALAAAPHVDLAVDPDLPAAFDWREQVAGGLTPVRNQGQCGSCWAFAVTGVLEQIQKIAHPEQALDLSEQAVVSCSGTGSCGGGYFDAFDYLQSRGAPTEKAFPYYAADVQCRSGLKSVAKVASWTYIGGEGREPTTAQIKTAIKKYGPVAVDVEGSFSSYGGGIFNDCYPAETDHMVVLVGWNDAGKYWIMRNSWGSDWGEGGYMRIRYTDQNGQKCNNVGQTAAFAVLGTVAP